MPLNQHSWCHLTREALGLLCWHSNLCVGASNAAGCWWGSMLLAAQLRCFWQSSVSPTCLAQASTQPVVPSTRQVGACRWKTWAGGGSGVLVHLQQGSGGKALELEPLQETYFYIHIQVGD